MSHTHSAILVNWEDCYPAISDNLRFSLGKPPTTPIPQILNPGDLVEVPGMGAPGGIPEFRHITVLFGVSPDFTAEDLDTILVESGITFQPLRFSLGMISLFCKPDYDVIKLPVLSVKLHLLNHFLRDRVPMAVTEGNFSLSGYKAHLTLGYVRAGVGDQYKDTALPDFSNKLFRVSGITLSTESGLYKIALR